MNGCEPGFLIKMAIALIRMDSMIQSIQPTNPSPEAIAEKIATAIYRRLIPTDWDEIAIILDQRGNGPRRGTPLLQDNCKNLDIPILVFRPSLEVRSPREV